MRRVNPRIALGVLVAVNLLGDFLFCPAGYLIGNSLHHDGTDGQVIAVIVFFAAVAAFGALLSQVVLLGIWAAGGDEPLLVRWPRSMFLLVLGFLALFVGFRLTGAEHFDVAIFRLDSCMLSFATIIVAVIFACTLTLSSAALWISRRRVAARDEVKGLPRLTSSQFSLARLAIWTGCVAFVLGMGRLLPPVLFEFRDRNLYDATLGAWYGAGVLLYIAVPLLLAAAPLAPILLSDQITLRRGLVISAMYLALLSLGECVLLLMWEFENTSPTPPFDYRTIMTFLPISGDFLSFNLAVFIEFASAFSLVRLYGYRMVKKELAN